MSEYVVDFGDKSTAFVGLAMAEAESHGATLMERVVRCRDCSKSIGGEQCMRHKSSGWSGNTWVDEYEQVNPDGFCAWGERRDA